MSDPAMPTVWIAWGQDPDRVDGYSFPTLEELNAFLEGVDAAAGWTTYEQFDTEAEASAFLAEHDTPERDWVSEVGAPAYAAIAEMVSAVNCDYDRLEELREERDDWLADNPGRDPEDWGHGYEMPDDAQELAELTAAAGDCENQEEARERIQEDALSLRIFGERTDGEWSATEAELLLATGGPAVRIMVELDDYSEPRRAWMEVQDWGTPWTQYQPACGDTLLDYCRQYCFE